MRERVTRQRPGHRHAWLLLWLAGGCQELLSGADAGTGADLDAGAGSGTPQPGCGLASEPEPNDSREQAAPLPPGVLSVGCLARADDLDFYEIAAPAADSAGGFYQVAITAVGAGRLEIRLTSAADNGQIERFYSDDLGQSLFFYFAAAPAQRYRISVGSLPPFAAGYRYTLQASYTKLDDRYEPNDSRDTARMIAAGTAIDAYLFAGHATSTVQGSAFQDWYAVTLPAGVANLKVSSVPTNVRVEAFVFDDDGNQVDAPRMSNDTYGGGLDVAVTIAKAGRYRLQLGAFPPAPLPYGKGSGLPDNFTRPYHLSFGAAR